MTTNVEFLRDLQASVYPEKQTQGISDEELARIAAGSPDLHGDPSDSRQLISNMLRIREDELACMSSVELRDRLSWQTMIEPFLDFLPVAASESLRRVAYGSLPTLGHIAETFLAPDANPIIVFQDGLIVLLSHYNWIQHFKRENNCESWVRQYYWNELLKLLLMYVRGSSASVSLVNGQLSSKTCLACTCETQLSKLFVACHELAHVHSGHLTTAETTSLQMTTESKVPVLELQKYTKNQTLEFEADGVAFEWYRQYLSSDSEFASATRELLPDGHMFQPIQTLYIFNWLETTCSLGQTNRRTPSNHPHTIDRMQKLASDHWKELADDEKKRVDEMLDAARKQEMAFSSSGHGCGGNRQ